MKRFIMIMLVVVMALTMFACGKEVTSSESSLSTVSMPESSSLYTNSAPPLPESSSAPSDTQVTPQKEYIEKLVPYIPEGVDLKEYIVGKWHTAFRTEERYPDNSVEEVIYYYYYDFKPDGTMETSGCVKAHSPINFEPTPDTLDYWEEVGMAAPYNNGTYTVKDNKIEIQFEEQYVDNCVDAHTADFYLKFISDDYALFQQRSENGWGCREPLLYVKGDITIRSVCEILGVDTTPPSVS